MESLKNNGAIDSVKTEITYKPEMEGYKKVGLLIAGAFVSNNKIYSVSAWTGTSTDDNTQQNGIDIYLDGKKVTRILIGSVKNWGNVTAMAVQPDGGSIAVGFDSGKVELLTLDPQTYKVARRIQLST